MGMFRPLQCVYRVPYVYLEPVFPGVYFAAVNAQVPLFGVAEVADDRFHFGATPVEDRGIAAVPERRVRGR